MLSDPKQTLKKILLKAFSFAILQQLLPFDFRGRERRIVANLNMNVYVNKGAYTYQYDKDCHELKDFMHDIKKGTLDEAYRKGKKKL